MTTDRGARIILPVAPWGDVQCIRCDLMYVDDGTGREHCLMCLREMSGKSLMRPTPITYAGSSLGHYHHVATTQVGVKNERARSRVA